MTQKYTQRGSAILIAMISSLVVGIATALIMQQSQVTETSTRGPRVKSAMAAVESQLIAAAYDGTLFTNCVAGDEHVNVPGCKKVNPAELPKYQVRLPGAVCSGTGVFCGIQVQGEDFNPTTQILTARIVYNGEEAPMKAIEVSTQIGTEAWASQTGNCPAATPLLVGFLSSGAPDCRALPTDCPAGQYMSSFDPMSITGTNARTCASISGTPSCPAGQFISNFQWSGGSNFQVSCQPVFNPFVPVPAALGDGTSYTYAAASMGPQATWATTTTTPPPPPPPPPPPMCATGVNTAGNPQVQLIIVCTANHSIHSGNGRPDFDALKAATPAGSVRNFGSHLADAYHGGWTCLVSKDPSFTNPMATGSRSESFTMAYVYGEVEWNSVIYSGWAGEQTSNADQCELRGSDKWGDCYLGYSGAMPPGITLGQMVNTPSTIHGYWGTHTCTPPPPPSGPGCSTCASQCAGGSPSGGGCACPSPPHPTGFEYCL